MGVVRGVATCEKEVREMSRPTLFSIHSLASGISFPAISYLHRTDTYSGKEAHAQIHIYRMRVFSNLPFSIELGLSAGVEEKVRISVTPSVPLHHRLPAYARIQSVGNQASI